MRAPKVLFAALFLTVLISLQLVPPAVRATTSETFPLALYTSITRNVELQKDDRFVGDFTITDIPWWTNAFVGVEGYSCSVTIFDPNNNVILNYANTIGHSSYSGSFNHTAFYSGVYKIEFSVGSEYWPPSGLGNPIATINYNVVAPSSIQSGIDPSLLTTIVVVAMLILAGAILTIVLSRRKPRQNLPQPAPPPFS